MTHPSTNPRDKLARVVVISPRNICGWVLRKGELVWDVHSIGERGDAPTVTVNSTSGRH